MGTRLKPVEANERAIQARLAAPKQKVTTRELRGVKIVSDRKQPFTADLAAHYLELDPAPYERPVREKWVSTLVEKMTSGLFRPEDVNINIAVCAWDGKERRLNGQHTCWARLELPESWKPSVHVVKYEVKTEKDYRLLYMQKDQISPRSRGQRDKTGLFGTEDYLGVPAKVVVRLAQGFAMWYFERPQDSTSEDVTKLLLGKYGATGRKVAELLDLALKLGAKHTYRQAVYAAMFETVEKAGDQAMTFWERLLHSLNFKSQQDPAKVLDKYLHEVAVGGTGQKKKSVHKAHMYNVCVECFNADKSGKLLPKTPAGKRDHRSVVR